MSVLIINQCTHHKNYKKVIDACNSTWVDSSEYKVINYYGEGDIVDDKNSVIVDAPDLVDDDYDPRGEKFIKILKHCIENEDYDYIYRTTPTSYIDTNVLSEFITQLPKNKVYYGAFNMYKYKYLFLSGFHVLMSRDVVEVLINHEEDYYKCGYPEDLATGYTIFESAKYLDDFNGQVQKDTHNNFINASIEDLESAAIRRQFICYRLNPSLRNYFNIIHSSLSK